MSVCCQHIFCHCSFTCIHQRALLLVVMQQSLTWDGTYRVDSAYMGVNTLVCIVTDSQNFVLEHHF